MTINQFMQIWGLLFVALGLFQLWKSWQRHNTWSRADGIIDFSYLVSNLDSDAPPSEGQLQKMRVTFYDQWGKKKTFMSFQPLGHRFLTFGKEWPAGLKVTVQYLPDQIDSARIATPWIDIFQAIFIVACGGGIALAARLDA